MPYILCSYPPCQKTFYIKAADLKVRPIPCCSRRCRHALRRLRCDERTTKRCAACKKVKPVSDFYLNKSGRKQGIHHAHCKNCSKIFHYAYLKAHPGKDSLYSRRYFLTHKLLVYKHTSAWNKRNRERLKITAAVRYANADKTKLRQQKQAWRKANPEKYFAQRAKRRANLRNTPRNDFTAEQWLEMQIAFNHRCAYCGKRWKDKLTQDHITPLSKGGAHTRANIVPACHSCNAKKYTGPPLKPVQPLLL